MSENDDKREIVSLRHRDNGNIHFIRVNYEDGECLYETGGNAWRKSSFHIRRNLAAMPHDDFGRKCEVWNDDETDKEVRTFNAKRETSYYPYAVLDEKGYFSTWKHYRFLDETPDIKITVEINGEISSLSEISEETLLRIRNKSK